MIPASLIAPQHLKSRLDEEVCDAPSWRYAFRLPHILNARSMDDLPWGERSPILPLLLWAISEIPARAFCHEPDLWSGAIALAAVGFVAMARRRIAFWKKLFEPPRFPGKKIVC